MPPRFELDEEDAFRALLKEHPRVVALLRGRGCPYSAAFEPAFSQVAPPEGWTACVRLVEEGGRGPVAEALRVDVTPTVVAFADGREVARLPGKLLLGITRGAYARWLRTLGE